jgi:hypothetical protein
MGNARLLTMVFWTKIIGHVETAKRNTARLSEENPEIG